MSLTVTFLGSGSSGNAAVVRAGQTTVLLDCGFSARETARRMALAGLDAAGVGALLVTHEHSDHISGVAVFARRHRVPVFATEGTLRRSRLHAEPGCDVFAVVPDASWRFGDLDVRAFRTSHDACDPVGYVFAAADGTRLGIASDLGFLSGEACEALTGCDLLGIETNHDEDMLAEGPYPYFLKRRIASDRGHLSNAAAAAAMDLLGSDRLRLLVGLHVSRQNNTPDLALAALARRAASLGLATRTAVASQDAPLSVAAEEPQR